MPATAYLRRQFQRRTDATRFENDSIWDAIIEALMESDEEHYVEWSNSDISKVAMLDVDWHGVKPPGIDERTALMTRCRPQPAYWWVSRSGGLHLLYRALADIDADTFAAVAATHFLSSSTCTGVEVLSRTRGTEPTNLVQHIQDASLDAAREWINMGGVPDAMGDDGAVSEWLQERGWSMGERLEHEHCLIDPRPNQQGGNPVLITPKGVNCFVCGADTPGAGFRSWGWLLGSREIPKIEKIAKEFVPWSNVRPFLSQLWGRRAAPRLLRALYKACLITLHGPDHPLINRCFIPFPYLLGESGVWLNAETYEPTDLKDKTVFGNLASAMWVRRDPETGEYEKPKRDLAKWSQHYTGGQMPPGYPVHQVVHGSKLWGQHLDYPDEHVRLVCTTGDAVHYRSVEERNIEDAWATLERAFPGIDRKYLLLLLAARAYAESGMGPVPMIMVAGPSGAGKSAIPRIAAELLDDKVAPVAYKGDVRENLAEALGYAYSQSPGWVVVDEFAKNLRGEHAADAFTPFLLTDREFAYRRMYRGPVVVTVRSAIIVTNTAYPNAVRQDAQIGRRFVRVDLSSRVPEWQRISGDLHGWRARDPENHAAAETIMSYVADRWFSADPPSFREIASELGYSLQLDRRETEGVTVAGQLSDLYEAVCAAEDAKGRWKGRGWKAIRWAGDGKIGEAWEALHDKGDITSSRRVSETDIAAELGLRYPARLEVSAHGQRIAFRFVRQGVDPRSSDFKVNGELRGDQDDDDPDPAPRDPEPEGGDTPEGQGHDPDGMLVDDGCAGAPTVCHREAPTGVAERPVDATSSPCQDGSKTGSGTDTRSSHSGGDGMETHTRPFIFVDLETRSLVDLKKRGGLIYAQDESTSIMCAAFVTVDSNWKPVAAYVWDPLGLIQDPQAVWPDLPFDQIPVHIGLPPNIETSTFAAHNAFGFDLHVWKRLGPVQPLNWIDTLPFTRLRALPGQLDKVGTYLFGQGKTRESSLMLKLSKPLKNGQFIPLSQQNLEPCTRYCLGDTLLMAHTWYAERLWEFMGTHEHAVINADATSNLRGICFDGELGRAVLALSDKLVEREGQRIEAVTGGEITATDLTRRDFILKWLRGRGLNLPDLRGSTVQAALRGDFDGEDDAVAVDPLVWDVLRARYGATRITSGKLAAAFDRMLNGRLYGIVAYHSAHTGRWGGRGFQPQNLTRGLAIKDILRAIEQVLAGELPDLSHEEDVPEDPDPHDILGSIIRPCLIPSPGKMFAVVDLAKIEVCGLAWFAQQGDLLDQLESGADPYKALASRVFGIPIDDVTKAQRQLAKSLLLGCGYNMGANGFARYASVNNIDLASVGLTPAQAVNSYRDAYPKIAGARTGGRKGDVVFRRGGLWKDTGYAAMNAVAGRASKLWHKQGPHLILELPSGRQVHYRDAAIEDRVPGFAAALGIDMKPRPTLVFHHPQYGRTTTFGGRLVENLVQATCRDLLARSIVLIEQAGYQVVLHVHDEVVVEIPEDDCYTHLDTVGRLMTDRPGWADGLPLGAEGFVTPRYVKAPPKGEKEYKWRAK